MMQHQNMQVKPMSARFKLVTSNTIEMFEEALRLRKKISGIEAPGTLSTMGNLALYYEARNQLEEAESFYVKAFESRVGPIELLELDYANFLWKQGRKAEALENFEIAVSKNEPEAIRRMKELSLDK